MSIKVTCVELDVTVMSGGMYPAGKAIHRPPPLSVINPHYSAHSPPAGTAEARDLMEGTSRAEQARTVECGGLFPSPSAFLETNPVPQHPSNSLASLVYAGKCCTCSEILHRSNP